MSTPNAAEGSSFHQGKAQTWTRDGFLISTDPRLVSISSLTSAFAADFMYWAKPLPADAMKAMVANSLNFGLYTPTPQAPPAPADPIARVSAEDRPGVSRADSTGASMIGYARVITDGVTLAYLTDVYVLPEWKGQGLGKWLIECVQAAFEDMPHLRRSMLVTGKTGPAVGFYERMMGMEKIDGDYPLVAMSWKGPGASV